MGSEMCIRDRAQPFSHLTQVALQRRHLIAHALQPVGDPPDLRLACLLYTSDAADERSSVDLGGRRIIKKKKMKQHALDCTQSSHGTAPSQHTVYTRSSTGERP